MARKERSIDSLVQKAVPEYVGAVAAYPKNHALEEKFIVRSNYGDFMNLAACNSHYTFLPRAVCPPSPDDRRAHGVPQKFPDLKFNPLTEDQATFVPECLALLKAGESFVARAATGFGKTVCTMPLIAAVGTTTLITVHKEDLVDRWVEELRNVLQIKQSEIGLIKGDVCDVAGKKVVLGMVQSLCKRDRYPSYIKNLFGLHIADEVHRLGAEEFVKMCLWLPTRLRVGLSATPTRKDGMDIAFRAHIGETRVIRDTARLGFSVIVAQSSWRQPRDSNGNVLKYSKTKDGHIRRYMTKDPVRNAGMARLAKAAIDKGRWVILFVERREHAELMSAACYGAGVKSKDTGFYVGQESKADLEKAKTKRLLIATFAFMSEGTDDAKRDTIILGAPRGDVEQIVGRILRPFEVALGDPFDKQPPVVIDIYDGDSEIYRNYAIARAKFYKERGAPVHHVKL